jgi:hypothetical protein
MGFWVMLAEKIAVAADGEPDMDRGQRLEPAALARLAAEAGIVLDMDPGVWLSDEDEDIALSPDSAEPGDSPTYAAEAKCLNSANHLKYVIEDQRAKATEDYKAIDSIPNDAKCAFREQVIQYFVVNEKLEKLYFVLYDDRIGIDKYVFHVIVVERKDIEAEIAEQKDSQLDTLREINQLIAELAGE